MHNPTGGNEIASGEFGIAARDVRATVRGACLASSALALFLMLCLGCCNPRGFILRGDWSIEANRLPWMAGHGAEYEANEEDCDEDGDGKPDGKPGSKAKGEEDADHEPSPADEEIKTPDGDPPMTEEPTLESEGPGPGEPHALGVPGEADSQASVTLAAPVRFHPVPTRPVFESRVERSSMTAPAPDDLAKALPVARKTRRSGKSRVSSATSARLEREAKPNQRARIESRETRPRQPAKSAQPRRVVKRPRY